MTKKTWIKLKRGILEPKHRERIGIRLWLYLHILDRANWEEGAVLEWRDEAEAGELEMDLDTLRVQRRQLEADGYIRCKRRGHHQRVTILKWVNPREYSGQVHNPPDVAGTDEEASVGSRGLDENNAATSGRSSCMPSCNQSLKFSGSLPLDSHITYHKEQEHSRVGLSKAEQDAVRKTMEEHFKALTSLTSPPNKKEAGELWWAPLREACDLVDWLPDVGKELLGASVQRAKQNCTEVASPKSIIKYARAIRAAQLRGEPIGLGGNGRGNRRQGYDPAADMAAFKDKRGLK